MLYHLLYPLHSEVSFLNVTQYITFRTAAASITAFLFSIILGPCVIRLLGRLQVGQVVRNDGPKTHETKAGTPTMGGLLILGAAIVPTLLWVISGSEPKVISRFLIVAIVFALFSLTTLKLR